MISPCPDPPPSGSRVLPRDIVELKALAERQPELAPAAPLQVGSDRSGAPRPGPPHHAVDRDDDRSADRAARRAASRCSTSIRSPSTGTTCGC